MSPTGLTNCNSVIQNQEEPENQLVDAQSENTQSENACEEWMIASDQITPFHDHSQTNSESTHDWHSDRFNYSEQQIGEMTTWIKKHEGINLFHLKIIKM